MGNSNVLPVGCGGVKVIVAMKPWLRHRKLWLIWGNCSNNNDATLPDIYLHDYRKLSEALYQGQ